MCSKACQEHVAHRISIHNQSETALAACPNLTGRHCADRHTLHAVQVMQLLDRLYTKFDQLVSQYELFKVETIGPYQCCWPSVDPQAVTIGLMAIGHWGHGNSGQHSA